MASIKARHGVLLACGAALGGFLFGFDTSTMNSAINGISATLELGSGTIGAIVAVSLIGCAIGAWFAGPIATRLGRNRVMFIAAALLTIGSLGAAVSQLVWLLGVFRLFVGLGIGAASAVVPAYITEISPPTLRGRLGSLWQFAIVIGQLLGLLAGLALSSWAGSQSAAMPWGGAAWRWMFVGVAIPAALYLFVTRRLSPTPYDLVRRGDTDAARVLLTKISDAPVGEQLEHIQQALANTHDVGTLRDLRGPRIGLLGILWIGIMLAAFQQLVGINVVKSYSTLVWKSVGFSTTSSFWISIVTVLISIVATIIAILIMDKIGRRTLLAAGAAVMVISLAAVALAFSTGGSGDELELGRTSGVTALVAINVFAIAFGITWGPVMWLMLGELFNSKLRTSAVAVCVAVNWITNWLVTRTFPLLADLGLGVAYGLYAVFATVALIFVVTKLPETRGRPLS
jgi:SP family sugar:H+ symporter-like MFS transporter